MTQSKKRKKCKKKRQNCKAKEMIVEVLLSIWVCLVVVELVFFSGKTKTYPTTGKEGKTEKLPTRGTNSKGWAFVCGTGAEETDVLGNRRGRSRWLPGESGNEEEDCSNFDREVNPNAGDRVYRQEKLKESTHVEVSLGGKTACEKAAVAATRGSLFYSRLQTKEGFWAGDYGGPMFLLPGLVIACHVTNVDLGQARKAAMLKYIMNHQQFSDGGWGMHIEGHSTVFGSCLNYTAARLLGLGKDDKRAVHGRQFIRENGGAIAAPQWAKFWLALLGAYEWDGVNPTPPELWLLPYWFPFHPGRMWCHCRMVYLPMSALFGKRWVYEKASSDPVVMSLREELYEMKYESINWGSFHVRECISPLDLYNPQHWLMTAANHILHWTIENPVVRTLFAWPLGPLRRRALKFAHDYIHAEDVHTNWIDIGPVSKAFHIVAAYAEWGPESDNYKRHIGRIDDYLWLAEDGMKMQGYNGSQFWDTCFAAHAFAENVKCCEKIGVLEPHMDDVKQSLVKMSAYIDDMQIKEDVWQRDKYFRDKSLGGWPFSSNAHGWPISDCSSEGLKTTLLLESLNLGQGYQSIPLQRLEECVDLVINLQNTSTDNGWASYELNRGYNWYEILNPAQVFGDIMIDYSYVECTSACVQGLCKFAKHFPTNKMTSRALQSAKLGADYIISKQRLDGSWYGSWAVCFTYAAWFGVDGLFAVLNSDSNLTKPQIEQYQSAALRACNFLLSKQLPDGGWGESVKACATQEWEPSANGDSQVVQTSWALLALLTAAEHSPSNKARFLQAAHRAVSFLISRQTALGDWEQESITGVFNKSCAITYTAYRNVFPIWALSRFAKVSS